MAPPTVYFVLGGPGAGKGTQCSRMEQALGFRHISAGDCLRDERNNPDSAYGQMINDYIKEGRIVPVAITCSLLKKRMESYGWNDQTFLIDGFPRNQDNLDGWNESMADVNVPFCLFIDCSQEVMEQRLLKRSTHSGRVDDNVDSIRKRFLTYLKDTMPIIEHFDRLGKCRKVDGSKSVDEVWESIRALFV